LLPSGELYHCSNGVIGSLVLLNTGTAAAAAATAAAATAAKSLLPAASLLPRFGETAGVEPVTLDRFAVLAETDARVGERAACVPPAPLHSVSG
jgi:hypothetical protein